MIGGVDRQSQGRLERGRGRTGAARWVSTLLLRAGESLLAVALVLVFFLGFWWMLSLSFPKGPTLTDLMAGDGLPLGGGAGRGSSPVGLPEEDGPGEAMTAVLTSTRRSVKDKPASAIAWRAAQAGISLENGHAVQTFERSAAVISFTEGSALRLGENSLVVLKSWKQLSGGRRRRASLIVLDGTVQGKVAVPGDQPMDLEILAATGAARIETTTVPGESTEFSVQMHADGSSTVSLYEGAMEVATPGGRLKLDENRSVTLTREGAAGTPQALPGRPLIEAPRPGARFSYRTLPPPVEFRWQPVPGADGYRLCIARDAEFVDQVHESGPAGLAFQHGNLKAGDYYWKVSALRGELEGPASEPAPLRMVEDRTPPVLNVDFPQGIVRGRSLALRGRTEPGTAVFIGRYKVAVLDSGDFEHRVDLEPGINVLTVEAVDAAGNVSYRSQMVNAKF
jgi:hypothetical protein